MILDSEFIMKQEQVERSFEFSSSQHENELLADYTIFQSAEKNTRALSS